MDNANIIGSWRSVKTVGPGHRITPRDGELTVLWLFDGTAHAHTTDTEVPAGKRGVVLIADAAAANDEYRPEPFRLTSLTPPKSAGQGRVIVGKLFGDESPIAADLVAAELRIAPGREFVVWVDTDFAHAAVPLGEGLQVQETDVPADSVASVDAGEKMLAFGNTSDEELTAILLGSAPRP